MLLTPALLRRVFHSFRFISARTEVARAYGGLGDVDEPSDQVPVAADDSFARLARRCLQARAGLLDRIDVGAVGREEVQSCA